MRSLLPSYNTIFFLDSCILRLRLTRLMSDHCRHQGCLNHELLAFVFPMPTQVQDAKSLSTQKSGTSSREATHGGKEAAAEIVVPGATMSGLYLLSGVGPMELKKARDSNRAACTSGWSVQGLAHTSPRNWLYGYVLYIQI